MFSYPPLAFAPHTSRSVSWSADGRLVLLTGHQLERELLGVLNPAFPIGQEVHFNLQKLGDGFIFPPWKAAENSSDESEVDSDDIENGISNLTERQAGIYATCACWSPPGIGAGRECSLAWMAATGYAGIWEVGRGHWHEKWNLQKMIETHEYKDYKTRRMWKLRRRATLLEWAKPLRAEGSRWPVCFLSVANDAGELVVFRVSQKSIELVGVTRFGMDLDEGVPEPPSTGQTPKGQKTARRDDLINATDPGWREDLEDLSTPKPRAPRPVACPIRSVSWGPWIKEGDHQKTFILASFKHQAIIKTAKLLQDGTLEISVEGTVIGDAWSPQHTVSQVEFYDKIYEDCIVFAYAIQAQVRVVYAKADVKELIFNETFFVQTFENGYVDPVTALVFLEAPEGLELHLSTMGGGSQIVRPHPLRTGQIKPSPPRTKRRWNEVLSYEREDFRISNDIPYAKTSVWGLARSPLEYSIAAAYTKDADWALIYRMTAHQTTHVAFGEELAPASAVEMSLHDTIPSVYELPSEGFLSDASQMGDEGYEALKEVFRKRGFGKDFDLADVKVDGNITDCLARNIFHNRALKIARYQMLIRLLPQYRHVTGKAHEEIIMAVQYEPAVVAHLVANILSVPSEHVVSPLDRSCLYSAATLALVTFHQLSPLMALAESKLKELQSTANLPLNHELAYLQARKSGKEPPGKPLLHPFANCKSCEEPWQTADLAVFECKNEHRVLRCSITFLPIIGNYKRCKLCERPVITLDKKNELEVDDENHLVSSLLDAWDVCAYCGGTYAA